MSSKEIMQALNPNITFIDSDDSTEPIHGHFDYLINKNYPYVITKKSNGREIKETMTSKGYIVVRLNGVQHKKHRLIALQWLDNPNIYTDIDHINHDRADNHIQNLRWCSRSENTNNKGSYQGYTAEYVDEISPDAIIVKDYSKWNFDFLYFHENVFYFYNGIQFRKLHINEAKSGAVYVNCCDVDEKKRAIMYAKFKREYGLI
jgi:hypothetical protein